MRKITKQEAAQMVVTRGKASAVRTAIAHLKPGEVLLIETADWHQKAGPGQMLKRLQQSSGITYRLSKIANGSGWLVERGK